MLLSDSDSIVFLSYIVLRGVGDPHFPFMLPGSLRLLAATHKLREHPPMCPLWPTSASPQEHAGGQDSKPSCITLSPHRPRRSTPANQRAPRGAIVHITGTPSIKTHVVRVPCIVSFRGAGQGHTQVIPDRIVTSHK